MIMKRNSIIKLLFVLAASILLWSCSKKQPQYEGPALVLEPEQADFGAVSANDPIAFHEASLKAKNPGKEVLHIETIELPDGFSYELIPSRKDINAGEEAILKINMDARQASGRISKTAYIVCNVPGQPRIPLELHALVEQGAGASETGIDHAKIEFDHRAYDFGPIGRTDTVQHEFAFKNVGEKPLKILGLDTMCMCVTAYTTKKEIAPGESASIVATVEPWKYDGVSPWKSVGITTNDPEQPVVNVTVAADIIDEAVLEPNVVVLPNIRQGQGAKAQVKLLQEGKKELQIVRIDTSSPKITVSASPLRDKGLGYTLDITVSPDMPPGKFEEVITIRTNYQDYSFKARQGNATEILKDFSRLRLPIKGSVSGAVSVSPQKVNFGSSTPGNPIKRKVVLSSASSDIDIKSISVSDPSFHVLPEPKTSGRKHEITIEFVPEPPQREVSGELLISTAGGEFKVPVFAAVKLNP
jgi:hypothetical protein